MTVYNIIEIANSYGGDLNYLRELIDEFEDFERFGMKFQPFKYDEISLPDYEWYDSYKERFVSLEEWSSIINKAAITKDIWIDIFDSFSVDVIKENFSHIVGFKLQSSSVNNMRIINSLKELDLQEKILILNISAYSKDQIAQILNRYEREINPKEIVLQIGFQAYPTEFADLGISKIDELKKSFDNRISFTEHIEGSSDDSLYVPTFAALLGAEIIEKHVMHSTRKTKYDHHSSIKADRYKNYLAIQKRYMEAMDQPFINKRENEYLESSNQIPILATPKSANSVLGYPDLEFKRSNQKGLNLFEVGQHLKDRHILKNDKKAKETLKDEDFRPARIAACIACRLHSTRLPKKALLKIGELTSVELCTKNVLKFENVDEFILATSTEAEDAILENYIYNDKVRFFKGDPLDVIKRFLDSVEDLEIDVIVRLTADNLYVSNDVFQILLQSHFEQGADYTCAKNKGVVDNMQIINVQALKKLKNHFPKADYSEYMTHYFKNNPEHFKINYVKLPDKLVRNYRLTLDYPEDLEVFRRIEEYLREEGKEFSIYEVYKFLDDNPEVANINKDITMKFNTNTELVDKLKEVTKIKS